MRTSKQWHDALKQARLMRRWGLRAGARVTARRIVALREVGEDLCVGCGNRILPDVCGCGSDLKGHGFDDGHPFVPMGCDCLRQVAKVVLGYTPNMYAHAYEGGTHS